MLHEEFVEKISHINPNIKIISKYKNSKTKVSARCLLCGHEWTPFPYNLTSGKGCVECERKRRNNLRKKKYAKDHNIQLLEIWYYDYDYDSIDLILDNYI